jgi:putative PIN family toxin of toxin-antitoxin system
MRIVLDANVLVSALISSKGAPAKIVADWQEDEFEVAISPPILHELDRALHYPKLQERHHLSEQQIRHFLHLLARQTVVVAPPQRLTVIEIDPDDNRYLECALAALAEVIVSGDRHLLTLGEYEGIQILSPAGFLAFLTLKE